MRKEIKKVSGVRNSRCVCGKVAFYSEEAVEFHLKQTQKLSFLNSARKEKRFYICEVAEQSQRSSGGKVYPVWHLTSMTEAKRDHRAAVWARATIWTCGVRGMPSLVLKPDQMRGRVSSNPWRMKVIVRVVVRKWRKGE